MVCYTAAMLFFIAMSFPAAAARLRLLKFGTFKFFRNGGKNMGFEQGAYGARIKQLRMENSIPVKLRMGTGYIRAL